MLDVDVLIALLANVLSWLVAKFAPSLLPLLLPVSPEEDTGDAGVDRGDQTQAISIGRPGGMEQLRLITLKKGVCTIGYNCRMISPPPFTAPGFQLTSDCVVIRNCAFSVNYADCCIRWGLYDSAKQYVGWPICPGFDVSGTVERVPDNNRTGLEVGDKVFGCSLFGAYSTRLVIPSVQLRKIPECLDTFAKAASIPAVALTALYALHLAGYFPLDKEGNGRIKFTNKSVLIHSCAGGVGSMLCGMSKILGLNVVGVVGRTSKVEEAKSLGCDVVIDKSKEDLWSVAEQASPNGYIAIFDANGVSTLRQSYDHLAPSGRLIVFGFHSNLPVGNDMLSPMEWIRMGIKMATMPKFDAMDLTVSNKSVLGFNLSFFADERDVLSDMFDQVLEWIEQGKLKCPRVVEMGMADVASAHGLIQSGKALGRSS
ncbi:hypothetical protein THAOC_08557 [Thalassiosira oceanica]|uniref:Enoyl reductase (ER) domain-containing protein n=1 Tax=Thalassiosira oceanica TaxID=159749 RepID=K0THX5_THAOC|nr:hypothetical protein THAOC_08557 [Thalassiosira oceanica]|eukprot:EJK70112.1 hypothetical protein THAOC_08557 [Thalassiosira oceanica]